MSHVWCIRGGMTLYYTFEVSLFLDYQIETKLMLSIKMHQTQLKVAQIEGHHIPDTWQLCGSYLLETICRYVSFYESRALAFLCHLCY